MKPPHEPNTDGELPGDLSVLEARINAILPPEYQFSAGPVNPRSMGSAALKYGPDSRVLWEEIWTTFCDLALAGGPPHRGRLLDAPTPDAVTDDPANYQLVSEEIARGIRKTTGLLASPALSPGWVAVSCGGPDTAAWLQRAVLAENVIARRSDDSLLVPAGPNFRLAKEIKNVIVSLAKTYHYWSGHFTGEARIRAGDILLQSEGRVLAPATWPEILPRESAYRSSAATLARVVTERTCLAAEPASDAGWIGVQFADEATAAWFVRAAIADDILARREEEVLMLPVPTPEAANPFEVADRLVRVLRIWREVPRSDCP